MLTIRDAQMEALQSQMARTFEDRFARMIESFFPDQANKLRETSDGRGEGLRSAIRSGTKRAVHYGINEEADIAAFLMLMFARSQFQNDWREFFEACRPIVESDELLGSAKMALIEHQLRRDAPSDHRAAFVSGMLMQLRGKG